MKHRIHKHAICPYYLHEDPQVIYCEGIEDNMVLHLAFANASNALWYKKEHCRKDYYACIICQLLEDVKSDTKIK